MIYPKGKITHNIDVLEHLTYILHEDCVYCWFCRKLISSDIELFTCSGQCSRNYHKSCLKYHNNVILSQNNQIFKDSTDFMTSSVCCFCTNSYIGCSYCQNFNHKSKLIKCSIRTCSNFYCLDSCLSKIRVIYFTENDLVSYFNYMKLPLEVLDVSDNNIICHSHFCYSCYDCDKYMYTWEKCWRRQLFNVKSVDANIAWDFLRRTCKGSIESSYFNKRKSPVKPPRMPTLLRIDLRNNTGIDIFDKLKVLNKFTQNTLYSCIRCNRSWCYQCIPPDGSQLNNSKNFIICHDCVHQQVHNEISAFQSKNSINLQKNNDISFSLHSNSQNIYRQLKSAIKTINRDPSYINTSFVINTKPTSNIHTKTFSNSHIKSDSLVISTEKSDASYSLNASSTLIASSTLNDSTLNPKAITKQILHSNSLESNSHESNSVEINLFNHQTKGTLPISRERLGLFEILPSNFIYIDSNYCTEENAKYLKIIETPDYCTCDKVCDKKCLNRSRAIEYYDNLSNNVNIDISNPKLSNDTNSILYISKVDDKGYGVFTSDFIYEGELLCEYTGEVITQDVYQNRLLSRCFRELDDGKQNHWYIMKIHKDVYVDSTKMGNISRYINHSCEPNCLSLPINYKGKIHMCIFSKRNINPNEEITYNYGFQSYGLFNGFSCVCGSKKCRGLIGNSSTDLSLEKTITKKLDGTTVDSLNELIKDMHNLFTTGNNSSLKPRPIPLDVLNGIFTSEDLEANEKITNIKSICRHLDLSNKIMKMINNAGQRIDYNELINLLKQSVKGPLTPPIDLKPHTHIEYLYTKLIALNGLSLDEYFKAKTKKFAIDLPWSLIAFEYNQQKSLNMTSNPNFFIAAKRFFQCYTLINVSHRFGKDALNNIHKFFDLSWGITESCVACGGYGDCTVCDGCGSVLHDKIACGDFITSNNNEMLCSVCQYSNHRCEWYLKNTIERELLAVQLYNRRLIRKFTNNIKYYADISRSDELMLIENIRATPHLNSHTLDMLHTTFSCHNISSSSMCQYVKYLFISEKLFNDNLNFFN